MSIGEGTFPDTGVTLNNLNAAWELLQFCATMEELQKHFEAIKKKNSPQVCEVCGSQTYWCCELCGKYICLLNKCHWNGARCAFLYHSEHFFGLARSNYIDVLGKGWGNGKRKTKEEIKKELENWKPPGVPAIERNACFMARLCADETGKKPTKN